MDLKPFEEVLITVEEVQHEDVNVPVKEDEQLTLIQEIKKKQKEEVGKDSKVAIGKKNVWVRCTWKFHGKGS